ncbi:hypothetical protein WS87_31965 [Burkholderia sp. MSMB0856]|nr:hypothetical protein WS87_31965 [Burkholderia sp. MSMB0856]KVH32523.1 hypothetical protein WS87_22435 [Burkholderia sp. MSMB0856]
MLAGDGGMDVANADTMVRNAPRRTTEPHAMPGAGARADCVRTTPPIAPAPRNSPAACVQNVSARFQVTAPTPA